MLNVNNNTVSDPQIIAETFNTYFSTIAEKTKAKLQTTETLFSNYLNNPNVNSFFMRPTTSDEIIKTIYKLNNSKSNGPISIPTNILKIIAPTISKHLSNIINNSFSTGVFQNA